MNREAKSQSALIALARTRRMQRALAHAYLHRNAPMPTLRTSLGFMMQTASIASEAEAVGHAMTVLGYLPSENVAYIEEDLGDGDRVIYKLHLRGLRAGHLVPVHAAPDALVPCRRVTTEAWMLSTRVVQRRALRTRDCEQPIRKFALQLVVEPVAASPGSAGASGKTTVTAFLHPQAKLVEVLSLPGDMGLARVTYTGIPSGLGLSKDTVILLASGC